MHIATRLAGRLARSTFALAVPVAFAAGGPAAALHAQDKVQLQLQVGQGQAAAADTGLEVGKRAPVFTLPWADKAQVGGADQPFGLQQAVGKPVVLAFYPKDFTGGCTAQMQTFTKQYAELFGPDVVVVGISADSLETHRRFAASLELPFKLLSDSDQRVARLYASAGARGYNKRTVYVIDREGKIAYRNMAFGAIDPQAYAELKAAVQRARG